MGRNDEQGLLSSLSKGQDKSGSFWPGILIQRKNREMFPGVFEWVWDPGHLIFMGIFWAVVLVLLIGVVKTIGKTLADTRREHLEAGDEFPGNDSFR